MADALGFLADHRLVHPVQGQAGKTVYHWASDSYPANNVSLRSIGWDNFVIIDLHDDRTIGEMDFRSTHTMLHEQAIYQHAGEQYQVEKLDFDNHKAFVRRVKPDYFTDAMTHVKVAVLEQEQKAAVAPAGRVVGPGADAELGAGDVSVIEKVVGYKKIKYGSHENVGYGEVRLPEMQMHTTAFWLMIPESVVTALQIPRPIVLDALRGLTHALHTVAAIGLMIDPRDLGYTLGDRKDHDQLPGKTVGGGPGFDPTLFLYDRIPGGIGLSPRIFDERDEILRRGRRLIEACECADGCPGCVGPVVGAEEDLERYPSRKRIALVVLEQIGVAATH